ncbi:hypothetical protein BX666DRAFT_2016549 [Dichotomocladium elegans]|nr:hypothetical protein BX666DRAFT_2016549 [Dichotomocladium elegans]
MMQLVHGSELNINLETENIILHGTADESAGVVLRGSLIFSCTEMTKIKSVVLKFEGKVKVNWTEGHGAHQKHYKQEEIVIDHTWNFMEFKKKTYHLPEGRYHWDFELPLPGNLPGTVQHDLGQVCYRLKGVVERPAFSMNYVAKRDILVTRLMLPSSLELSQSVVISNDWADKISYNISVPRKVFSYGSLIPITFDLIPIASGLAVGSILCTLKEYTTLSSHEHTRTEGRIVKTVRDNRFHSRQDRYTCTVTVQVPKDIPNNGIHIQTDSTSSLISIKHKLKFVIVLLNADGHISELRAVVPIIIASVSADQDANELPSYEDAWKSLPYDADTVASLIAAGAFPVVSSSSSSSSSRSSHIDDDEDHLPWEGFDLTRVPSYATAVRSNRLHSFSGHSLPPYESLMAN